MVNTNKKPNNWYHAAQPCHINAKIDDLYKIAICEKCGKEYEKKEEKVTVVGTPFPGSDMIKKLKENDDFKRVRK